MADETYASIACPVCQAQAWERCYARNGQPVLGGAHAVRVGKARGDKA